MESEESSKKSKRNGGHVMLRGAVDGVPFSSDNQPSGELKSEGKRKARLLKDLLAITVSKKIGTNEEKEWVRLAAKYFQIPEDEIDIQQLLHFRQIQRALTKSDTYAYTAVMDRAFGKPKQQTELTGKDGETMQAIAPIIQLCVYDTGIPLAESEDQIS